MYQSYISGVGSFLPENVITNHDLEKLMETTDEWIVQRTGIKERRWVSPETGTSDLALKAALDAIKDAGLLPSDIDMIVLATIGPDHDFPGTGCFLQAKLGLSTVPALDIRQQCTGFIYALSIADHFIRGGQYKNILVVGAEIHSKGLDKTTRGRDVAILFGDGAGVAVLSRATEKTGLIYSTHLHAEGQHAKELWIEAPGAAINSPDRLTAAMVDEGRHFPKMNGKKVYVHAVKRMCESIREALEANQKKIEDVDLFLFHQANLRINEAVAQTLGIPSEKVFNTIQFFGNTTAATIPIGMVEAKRTGVLRPGMVVALSAFGSGFTWGSALLKF